MNGRLSYIPTEERIALCDAANDGDQAAMHRLVMTHQHLIKGLASKVQKNSDNSLEFEDLFQQANIFLIEAIKSYDKSKGASITTWVNICVHDSLINYSKHYGPIVRVSEKVMVRIRNMEKTRAYLTGKLSREPEAKEIENFLEISANAAHTALSARRKRISLDSPVEDNGKTTLIDMIADDESIEPSEIEKFDIQKLENAKKVLNQAELTVITGRMQEDALSFEDLGKTLGVTGSRANYIYYRALKKLAAKMHAEYNPEAKRENGRNESAEKEINKFELVLNDIDTIGPEPVLFREIHKKCPLRITQEHFLSELPRIFSRLSPLHLNVLNSVYGFKGEKAARTFRLMFERELNNIYLEIYFHTAFSNKPQENASPNLNESQLK